MDAQEAKAKSVFLKTEDEEGRQSVFGGCFWKKGDMVSRDQAIADEAPRLVVSGTCGCSAAKQCRYRPLRSFANIRTRVGDVLAFVNQKVLVTQNCRSAKTTIRTILYQKMALSLGLLIFR